MQQRLGGRDRSGRIPRASRSLTFQQEWTSWNTNQPPRPILEPTNPRPHTENFDHSDEVRGQGY